VPLGFYEHLSAPGILSRRVAPVDIAATFASLLGVTQRRPLSTLLTQAFKPAAEVAYPKETPVKTRLAEPQPENPLPARNLSEARYGACNWPAIKMVNPVIAPVAPSATASNSGHCHNLDRIGGFVTKGHLARSMAGNEAPRLMKPPPA